MVAYNPYRDWQNNTGTTGAAATPEMAAEMYLASLIMVGEESDMERAYLDELSRQLNLPQGLRHAAESQARQTG